MRTSTVEEATTQNFDADTFASIRDTRRPSEKRLAVHLVLAVIFFLYAAFLPLSINLSNNLKYNKALVWSSTNSAHAATIFAGTNMFSMLVFSIISDAKLGRARTILIGFPLYLIGYILFTISTSDSLICSGVGTSSADKTLLVHENCAYGIIVSLILIAIGDGAVKCNLITFGADQTNNCTPTSRYFDKFVIIINLANILEELARIYILKQEQYFTFFVIALPNLGIAALLFLFGWRFYIHVKPYDSVLSNCIRVYKNAFQTWRQYRKDSYSNASDVCNQEERPSHMLDFAKLINHGKYLDRIVDDVKSLQNALIICILVFPYWFIFTQVYTTFPAQAHFMSIIDKSEILEITSGMFIAECVLVIMGILILNRFVYRYLHARNRSLTIAKKLVISMCFAFVTMLLSGGVELWRQGYCPRNEIQFNSTMNNSHLSIYAQIPQYISLGFADLFGTLATFQFAYFIAPRSAQSFFMCLYFLSRSIGNYILSAYMDMLSTYFQCHSDESWISYSYFYILAVIQLIFLVLFLLCKKSKIIKLKQRTESYYLLQIPMT